jgi:biopolymer transport protein ExbD
MAGRTSHGDDDADTPITEINVTPLVDVVLVLLIVFMITVPTIVTMNVLNERELSVQLAEASAAQPLTARPLQFIVNINGAGRYIVDGEERTATEIPSLIDAARQNNPGRMSVMIRADRAAPWQTVAHVINSCNRVRVNYVVTTQE